MNKEQVYDSKIDPLMAQIIAICNEHKIAAVCCFAIPKPGDDGLMCSTVLLTDEHLKGSCKTVRDNMLTAKQIIVDGFIAFTRRLK